MRWPWSRRSTGDDAAAAQARRDAQVAAQAREAAQARLEATKERGAEVERVAANLRYLRRRNEFATMIEDAFRAGGTAP